MSLLKDIIKKKSNCKTIQHLGWDRDLTSVPVMRWFDLSGATETQANASLYVDGGALVYDSDLAVAAGAAGNWSGNFMLATVPELIPIVGSSIHIKSEILARFETDGGFGWLGVGLPSRNEDGTAYTPPGAINDNCSWQARSGGQIYAYSWGGQDYDSYGNTRFNVVSIEPTVNSPCRSISDPGVLNAYYGTNNTFAYSSDFSISSPRLYKDGPLDTTKFVEPYFGIFHYLNYTPRVYGKIYSADIIFSDY